jgi:thymidylate kinase
MDGSGKSTQIQQLTSVLQSAGLSVQQRAFWDHVVAFPRWRAGFSHKFLKSEGGIGAPDKPVRRNDKNNRAWYLTLGRYGLYLLDAINLRKNVHSARLSQADVVIFDRFIYDQLATLPLESSLTRAYTRFVLKFAPKADIAFILDADPVIARQRKPEYPLDFLHIYRASYLKLREMAGLTLIAPDTQDRVHHNIMTALMRKAKFQAQIPVPDFHSTLSND